MSLFHLRSIVALHAGRDIHAPGARVRTIMRRRTAKWLDESFFQVLRTTGAECFLECGARDASASRRFLRAAGRRAVAAEANPLTWERMTTKAEQHGVRTINCGIGPSDHDALDFFMPEDHRMASNASFMRKVGHDYKVRQIETRTIDSLCEEHFADGQAVALWIDVEGMALPALEGAKRTLETGRCVALKVEVETRRHWVGQHLASETDEFLTMRGYRPVLCDFEYADQFNVVYVKNQFIDDLEPLIQQRLFVLSHSRVTWLERLFKSRQYIWRTGKK